MGKVLSSYQNGFPGAIARAVDDIVVAMANRSETDAIAFGAPVALSDDKLGVVPFDPATHKAENFAGIAVRNPSKTPETYGSSEARYAASELVDVLVRGHIVVDADENAPDIGEPVGINTDGIFTDTASAAVALTNVRVSTDRDSDGRIEVLVTTRNMI